MVTTSKHPTPAAGEAAPASTTVTSASVNMTDSSLTMTSIVPSCPQGLCITKSDFLKSDFTVDNFFIEVSVREGGTSLDTLRDDLGVYLKVLRSSMIELINQDYADFVNLSTNLVGLDEGIDKIKEPLVGYNDEIKLAKENLSSCLDQVVAKLSRQERIRQEKEMLGSLQQVAATTVKLERMVGSGDLNTDSAERIATDINQLNFAIWKLKDSMFIQQMSPRVTAACDALNTWLDDTCLSCLRDNNIQQLSRCLRIYATIDRVSAAERLVREEIVRPQVEHCLSDSENVTSERLGQVCQSLLRIIPEHLAPLIRLTTDEKKIVEGSVLGFDFLVNSFWNEVAESFQQNLDHVASPGNPDEFFKNYNTFMKFLDDLDMNIVTDSSLANIRNSDEYENLMKLWNLPVYFQLRFHQIAKPVESLMIATVLEKSEKFNFKATEVSKSAIELCFSSDIFLHSISHRFLQLSFQIVARYKVWAEFCLKTFKDSPSQEMKRSETSKNLRSLDTNSKKSLAKSSSERDLSSVSSTTTALTVTVTDIISLFSDITKFSSIIPEIILVPGSSSVAITKSVNETAASLVAVLPKFSESIAANIAAEPMKLVKSVGDIPRMYRRTNRDTPSKPCPYITSVVSGFDEFYTAHKATERNTLTMWLMSACDMVTDQFLVQVQDVLNNVTKMEESLRKLKKVRERGGTTGGEKDKSGGLSDDDKIRLQLYLDVSFFLRELENGKLVDMKSVLSGDCYKKIKLVVEEAVSSFITELKL